MKSEKQQVPEKTEGGLQGIVEKNKQGQGSQQGGAYRQVSNNKNLPQYRHQKDLRAAWTETGSEYWLG